MKIFNDRFAESKLNNFHFWIKWAVFNFYAAIILGQFHVFWSDLLSNIAFFLTFLSVFIGNCIYFRQCVFKEKYTNEVIQMAIVYFILVVFWNVSIVTCSVTGKMAIALVGGVVLSIAFIEYTYFSIRYYIKSNNNLSEIIRENIPILIVLFVFCLLFLQNFGVWFKVDSYTYYHSVEENVGKWNFSLNNMNPFTMGGHLAYAYAILLHIGEGIWHSRGNGVRVINLIMSLSTIFSFYKIFQFFMRNKNKIEATLATCIFMLAPLFFGISYLVSTDFPLLCFFVMFVYADLYDKKIFKWLFIMAVCFSKEIGIFVLAGYYIGECVEYSMAERKWKVFWKKMFDKKHMFFYSPCIVYAIVLLTGDAGWSRILQRLLKGEKESALENVITLWHYLVYKLVEMFFMNFAWIIFIFLIVFIWKAGGKKIIFNNRMLPILTSYLFFSLIGLAYFTYVHYRYVQLGLFFHTLLLGLIICNYLKSQRVRKICLTVIACLYFIESYVTIDPIMKFLPFSKVNAGNGLLLSTRKYFYGGEPFYDYAFIEGTDELMAEHHLAEGLEYNRTYIGLQRLMEKALEKIDYDSKKLIVLDNFGGWIENTNGQLFGVMDADGYFWDNDHRTVTRDDTGIPMNITLGEGLFDESVYSEIYYFDFVFNPYHKDEFLKYHQVIEHYEKSAGIWKVNIYRVK